MRKKYVDALRLLALFYMFFHHAALTLLRSADKTGIINFFYKIVPLDPALFLFIAGFSVSLTLEKSGSKSIQDSIHLFIRGIVLILSALLLFFIQFGFQLPDILVSSGILNSIGWLLIISGLLLRTKYKEIITFILIMLLIYFTYLLEVKNIYLVPLNSGYEPISPTVIFGFTGLLTGLVIQKIKDNKKMTNLFMFSLLIAGIILYTAFSIKYGSLKIIQVDEGTYQIERTFKEAYLPFNLLKSDKSLYSSYFSEYIWNYKTACFWACMGFVLALFSLFFFSEEYLKKYLPENAFLPGRFAFFNYFFHLSIIALFVLITGYNRFSAPAFLCFLLLLYLASYIISFLFLKFKMHSFGLKGKGKKAPKIGAE